MIPVICLVAEEVVERLQPVVDELADKYRATNSAGLLMRLNGWTPEMMAWGMILRCASEQELEIVAGS